MKSLMWVLRDRYYQLRDGWKGKRDQLGQIDITTIVAVVIVLIIVLILLGRL